MKHADFELLPIVPVFIEDCRGISSLCAVRRACAILQQAVVVTPVEVVRAHIDVRVFVCVILPQKPTRKNENEGRQAKRPCAHNDMRSVCNGLFHAFVRQHVSPCFATLDTEPVGHVVQPTAVAKLNLNYPFPFTLC